MEKNVKISVLLNPDEMKMFNNFKENASNATGLRMMVHKYVMKDFICIILTKAICDRNKNQLRNIEYTIDVSSGRYNNLISVLIV